MESVFVGVQRRYQLLSHRWLADASVRHSRRHGRDSEHANTLAPYATLVPTQVSWTQPEACERRTLPQTQTGSAVRMAGEKWDHPYCLAPAREPTWRGGLPIRELQPALQTRPPNLHGLRALPVTCAPFAVT
eukprot:3768285-Rhodomonas_salina.4